MVFAPLQLLILLSLLAPHSLLPLLHYQSVTFLKRSTEIKFCHALRFYVNHCCFQNKLALELMHQSELLPNLHRLSLFSFWHFSVLQYILQSDWIFFLSNCKNYPKYLHEIQFFKFRIKTTSLCLHAFAFIIELPFKHFELITFPCPSAR